MALTTLSLLLLLLALLPLAQTHTAAWAAGMYCRSGPFPPSPSPSPSPPPSDNPNTAGAVVNPLYHLTKSEYWFQNYSGCPAYPPPDGEFLELPAGGNFTVELAHNRAFTTLSYEGRLATEWPDGKVHPEDWHADPREGGAEGGEACLRDDGAMHTGSESKAAGTAFAIAYESEIEKVTLENLVVFTTLAHTPWKRIATYDVPKALPACPPGGCTCAWLWVPEGCGQSNMYMQGFKCNVTNATSSTPLATARKPVYCADDASKCVKGAKQMIVWHQAQGEDNIVVPDGKSPAYSEKCGWSPGAQDDIFKAQARKVRRYVRDVSE